MGTATMGPRAFGAWVRVQRKRLKRDGRGGTQEEVAERAGISRSSVAMIEAMTRPNGKLYDPGRETVEKLARALGGNVSEALLIAGYASPGMVVPNTREPETVELAQLARLLSQADFELLRNLARRLASATFG